MKERLAQEINEFVVNEEEKHLDKLRETVELFESIADHHMRGLEHCGCGWCNDEAEFYYEEYIAVWQILDMELRRLGDMPSFDHEEELLMDYALAKIGNEHEDDPMDKRLNDWSGE